MSNKEKVYLGLGGNIGDTSAVLTSACRQIAAISDVVGFQCSPFYVTSPVSDIPQGDYLNAVASFYTSLSPSQLFDYLQQIEKNHGKEPKLKKSPRILDVDILFFGHQRYQDALLDIPHPRWRERLFVLVPLFDLTTTVQVLNEEGDRLEQIDLSEMIRCFPNAQEQKIRRLTDLQSD